MIQVMPGTKVYLACRPVSMRYGFDGLAAQVQLVLSADPFSGHLFLFRSKRADYLKILYYDGTGMCLFAKRPAGERQVRLATDRGWRHDPDACAVGPFA
jgi:transposase